jgi:dephospho-CoA kinase
VPHELRVPALTVGLTGGIGSGKSAALADLVALGAVGIEADDIARVVVAPGTAGCAAVLHAFDVDDGAGGIDRTRLAAMVFADADARARLEVIVHPLVRAETRRLIGQAAPDAIVVNAVPLLVEAGLSGEYDVVVVVEAPIEVRLGRLRLGGMARADALARIAAQTSDEARRAVASWVIDNDGMPDELRARVAELWVQLRARVA